MSGQMPKHFIQETLIDGIGKICEINPYLSFALIAIGIEFLGKSISPNKPNDDWHKGKSKNNFERAIKELNSLKKYEKYLKQYCFWDSLRNGFNHSLIPKAPLSLSSKPDEAKHESISNNGKILNLKNPEFYEDFKLACVEVLYMIFESDNKMSIPILFVPQNLSLVQNEPHITFATSGVVTLNDSEI